MRMEGSAGRNRSASLKDHCERVVLKADNEDEARELAKFFDALTHGRPAQLQFVREDPPSED
jgi:hypothetical protein